MNSFPNLKLDWCSHQAAKLAVMRWHYSKRMPVFKKNQIGVWEDDNFIGVVMFGLGAAGACNGAQYGLARNFEIVELTRVALRKHKTPTSRIISIACKMLKKKSPKLRMIISFADSAEGHHGGIYQAAGWIYTGDYDSSGDSYLVNGIKTHAKTLHSRYGKGGQSLAWLRKNIDPNARRLQGKPKHRYLLPLDSEIRARIEPLAKKYPKRGSSLEVEQPPIQVVEGGAVPTDPLQISIGCVVDEKEAS